MSFKPRDFFLSIVTFIGVLLPGGVFIFLRGQSIQSRFTAQDYTHNWVVILVASYVVGQILLAVTEVLNCLAGPVARVSARIWQWLRGRTGEVPRVDSDCFHRALSFIRLRDEAAAGEVDHHMADYKLLRNLVAVFLIDGVWSAFGKTSIPGRAPWDVLLALLSFGGFVRMYYWANRLALQYRDLLVEREKAEAAKK